MSFPDPVGRALLARNSDLEKVRCERLSYFFQVEGSSLDELGQIASEVAHGFYGSLGWRMYAMHVMRTGDERYIADVHTEVSR